MKTLLMAEQDYLIRADALLKRADRQLSEWHKHYGKHQPAWLPPAGDVNLQEDISEHRRALRAAGILGDKT